MQAINMENRSEEETEVCIGQRLGTVPGNMNKGKGNGAGLASESQSHCFADVLHTHTLLVQTHNMTTDKEIA